MNELDDDQGGAFGLAEDTRGQNQTFQRIRRQEIFRRVMFGSLPRDIAADMGLSLRKVTNAISHPEIQALLKQREREMRQSALRRVKLQADELMSVFVNVALDPKEGTKNRLKAASLALDRIGLNGKDHTVNLEFGPALTTGELIQRADTLKKELEALEKANAEEAHELEAEIIDIEPEVDDA